VCRFILYMGPAIKLETLTTKPTNSIIHQSHHSRFRKEPLNGDGFGLAWYVSSISSEPAQFRSIQPAWSSVNLLHLARVCTSEVILAHVRAASPGLGVSEANCHPFTAGAYAFMHNGSVAGFPRLKRQLCNRLSEESYSWIHGTTDSEHVFALFRDHIQGVVNDDPAQRMADALRLTLHEIVDLAAGYGKSHLNFAVTDGSSGVVSRYSTGDSEPPSLYFRGGTRFVCEDNLCRMLGPGDHSSAIVVASEPLTDESEWQAVPPDHLLVISSDHCIDIQSCNPA
jgi:glutamine amidotransferase